MHPSSLENMQRCYDRHLAGRPFDKSFPHDVVEIGSADVNGSYRKIFPGERFRYLGCDRVPGPGVDLVLDDPHKIPLPDAYADVVVSGQMLEHCEWFWLVFEEMRRILKPDGFLFLIAPSAGPIHSYPVDCYRFYPDSFRALARYGGCRLADLWLDDRGPWNDLVGVFRPLSAAMPSPAEIARNLAAADEAYRERLIADAAIAGSSFDAAPEAEQTRGATPYLDILGRLHQALEPQLYLEIGVRRGRSLALATGPAVGVDPLPALTAPLPTQVQLYAATSDRFFEDSADVALARGVDLAFIDGMHWAEFVLRDVMNIERHARPGTLLAIDDIFPNHPLQAERRRATRAWCGDVWKIGPVLRRYRPDLLLVPLDAAPAGLLLVAGLDPAHRGLRDLYNPIARELSDAAVAEVPEGILNRDGALSPEDPRIPDLLALLRELARRDSGIAEARARLRGWRQDHCL